MLVGWTSCSKKHRDVRSTAHPITHEIWNGLLNKHVDKEGGVNYQAFLADSLELNRYTALLEKNHPTDKLWSREEQLAYWINAYNAFTIQLIIENYPLESIRDLGGKIPFVNSPWDIQFIAIEGMEYDLNHIEHNILRRDYEEPRIHFAINCASASCPRLLNEAYTAERLEDQLQMMAIDFINDSSKNMISEDAVEISKIFSWFKGDFTKGGSVVDYLNKYASIKINEKAIVSHHPYDWSLNDI